ncbi:MAG: hypothetical protein KJZ86_26215, partial [Caldilineaceae bacterium]|nr:hypothetical protein [Caldilineaceae bacterium]
VLSVSIRVLFSEQFSMRRVAPRRMKSGRKFTQKQLICADFIRVNPFFPYPSVFYFQKRLPGPVSDEMGQIGQELL